MQSSLNLTQPQLTRVNTFLAFRINTKYEVLGTENGLRYLCVFWCCSHWYLLCSSVGKGVCVCVCACVRVCGCTYACVCIHVTGAGPDLCTLHPDLCTLCLQWLSSAATYSGGVSPSAVGTNTPLAHAVVLYILYSMVSVQKTSLLPENASQNNTIFSKSLYRIYWTNSQCLNSYGCAIAVLYNVNNVWALWLPGGRNRVHVLKLQGILWSKKWNS